METVWDINHFSIASSFGSMTLSMPFFETQMFLGFLFLPPSLQLFHEAGSEDRRGQGESGHT
jgi:hypothetical protein